MFRVDGNVNSPSVAPMGYILFKHFHNTPDQINVESKRLELMCSFEKWKLQNQTYLNRILPTSFHCAVIKFFKNVIHKFKRPAPVPGILMRFVTHRFPSNSSISFPPLARYSPDQSSSIANSSPNHHHQPKPRHQQYPRHFEPRLRPWERLRSIPSPSRECRCCAEAQPGKNRRSHPISHGGRDHGVGAVHDCGTPQKHRCAGNRSKRNGLGSNDKARSTEIYRCP